MAHLSPQHREIFRSYLIGLATVIVLVVGNAWPSFRYLIWGVFLIAIAAVLYSVLRKPVNYQELRVTEKSLEYTAFGKNYFIDFSEISKLEFMREEAIFPDLTGPYIESKWIIHTNGGARIEVMDEWPHRRQLLRAFNIRLPGFKRKIANEGLRSSGEGKWLCFEVQAK